MNNIQSLMIYPWVTHDELGLAVPPYLPDCTVNFLSLSFLLNRLPFCRISDNKHTIIGLLSGAIFVDSCSQDRLAVSDQPDELCAIQPPWFSTKSIPAILRAHPIISIKATTNLLKAARP